MTADDMRACALEYKVRTTAILWARGDEKKSQGTFGISKKIFGW